MKYAWALWQEAGSARGTMNANGCRTGSFSAAQTTFPHCLRLIATMVRRASMTTHWTRKSLVSARSTEMTSAQAEGVTMPSSVNQRAPSTHATSMSMRGALNNTSATLCPFPDQATFRDHPDDVQAQAHRMSLDRMRNIAHCSD